MNDRVDHRYGLGFLLSLISARSYQSATRALADVDLSPRSFTILETVLDEPLSQREISLRLELDPSRIVALVDKLEMLGYVERTTSQADRRVRVVAPTAMGRSSYAELRAAVDQSVETSLAPLSKSERGVLLGLLARVATQRQEAQFHHDTA